MLCTRIRARRPPAACGGMGRAVLRGRPASGASGHVVLGVAKSVGEGEQVGKGKEFGGEEEVGERQLQSEAVAASLFQDVEPPGRRRQRRSGRHLRFAINGCQVRVEAILSTPRSFAACGCGWGVERGE